MVPRGESLSGLSPFYRTDTGSGALRASGRIELRIGPIRMAKATMIPLKTT